MRNERATQLAKILWYYNLIPNTTSLSQKIVCPLHDDVNPSLAINLEEGKWFCFGCNEHGGPSDFVIKMEEKYNGLNDLHAYIKYTKILKSDKCSNIVVNVTDKKTNRKRSKQMYVEAYDYYHGLRTTNWMTDTEDEVVDALEYMVKRGFDSNVLDKCKAKVTYNNTYGLVFPMLDNGKFKGWVCRTMRKDIEKKRKYLYNEGFSRATTLVGNYGKEKYLFIVEGYMDRLKFVQYGEENVVAILGWKMSAQQIEKIKSSGVTKIVSALDNDTCGRKGTKYLKSVFGVDSVVRWMYIRGVKDPGDMNETTFRKMYDRTMSKYKIKEI